MRSDGHTHWFASPHPGGVFRYGETMGAGQGHDHRLHPERVRSCSGAGQWQRRLKRPWTTASVTRWLTPSPPNSGPDGRSDPRSAGRGAVPGVAAGVWVSSPTMLGFSGILAVRRRVPDLQHVRHAGRLGSEEIARCCGRWGHHAGKFSSPCSWRPWSWRWWPRRSGSPWVMAGARAHPQHCSNRSVCR